MTGVLLMFSIPILLVGLVVVGIGGLGLYSFVFGPPEEDPFQWPEVEATVIDYRARCENRSRRRSILSANSEWVRVRVLVQLPGGAGQDVAEVRPQGSKILLTQPSGMPFAEFMARADELAVAEARRLYPVGSLLRVAADPQRNSVGFSQGRFWIKAHCRETAGSRVGNMLSLVFLMFMGAVVILFGGLSTWMALRGIG